MQTIPDKVVLNHITRMDLEAIIDFRQAKMKLFMNIYNWRVSFPNKTIYLVLADITACFCFQKISADITGAFRFLAEGLYFLSMGHVFGSNTSASSWEALRRAIQNLIPVYSQRTDLVEKHKDLIDLLNWDENPSIELVQAFECELNQGVPNEHGDIYPLMSNIYVDNVLGASAFKESTKKLLAAIIESIFLVCSKSDVSVWECPLSLKKWHESIVSPRQIILGLVVDMNKMTVGITDTYLQQVRELLHNWDSKKCMFKVCKMHKLLSKLARLGKGAPSIFKLMSHLYTSLAYALKNNQKLLDSCSKEFRELINQIEQKHFFAKQTDLQCNVNFVMKRATKIVYNV
jgi:hypothetical protein